jgi:formylglycine-generating enzyme required for sulfatase activity
LFTEEDTIRRPNRRRTICARIVIATVLLWAASTASPLGAAESAPSHAGSAGELRNSLGMVFHKVTGTSVRFSIWETRVSDWKTYLVATGQSWSHWPVFPQTDDHPVVNVTLAEARGFCNWLSEKEHASGALPASQRYRLPANNEWDAAVGTRENSTSLLFPWGSQWPPPPDAGNYNTAHMEGAQDDGFAFTAPVGKFRPSEDGLYDLGGNAWEWTLDLGPTEAAAKFSLRGASWIYWRKECLASSFVLPATPDMRAPSIGFRCVLEEMGDPHRESLKNLAKDRARAEDLLGRPKVSEEELRKMKSEYAEKSRLGVPKSADGGAGAMAAPGRVFVNSQGVKLIPLPQSNVLLAEHELRVRDFSAYILSTGKFHQRDDGASDEQPVTDVSWTDAVAFCLWLTRHEHDLGVIPRKAGYRLPKLDEWLAAGGRKTGDSSTYPWGDVWPPPAKTANLGVWDEKSAASLAGMKPVKTFPPNALGFYDLIGNAAEWCLEVKPNEPEIRTYCGGSWQSNKPADLQNNGLQKVSATASSPAVGFRLVLQLEEATP